MRLITTREAMQMRSIASTVAAAAWKPRKGEKSRLQKFKFRAFASIIMFDIPGVQQQRRQSTEAGCRGFDFNAAFRRHVHS
jgi:hypothetical protein